MHKYINLNELPKKGKFIDWNNSIGYEVYFEYNTIKDVIRITNYNTEHGLLTIKYNDKEYQMKTVSFKKVNFGKILNTITKEFKFDVGYIIKDDDRDMILINRQYRSDNNGRNWKYYQYKCNRCGWSEGYISEGNLKQGKGCACCSTPPRVLVKGINDIATTSPWMIDYFVNKEDAYNYTKSSDKRIEMKCPYCGKNKDKPIKIATLYTKHSIGCDCKDGVSYPNKLMSNILKSLNLEFISEYSPKWSNNKKYDFYIPSKKLIIEMDGHFHYQSNTMNGQTANKSKEIDIYKDELAEEHGLEIIRIRCDYDKIDNRLSYIKHHILNSQLINKINLSQIDWDKIDELSLDNFIKNVCEYYEEHKIEKTLIEISEKFDISYRTLFDYLHKGNRIGWCKYK